MKIKLIESNSIDKLTKDANEILKQLNKGELVKIDITTKHTASWAGYILMIVVDSSRKIIGLE